MKKIILAGGGTGGHCIPIRVIFERFKKKNIDCFIVTDKKGKSFFKNIDKSKIILLSKINESNKKIYHVINFPYLIFQSIKIFFKIKPRFSIGFGGFITFPFILIGSLMNFNVAVHEANAVFGKANKYLVKYVKYVFVTFSQTKNLDIKYRSKIFHVGMPIRNEINMNFKEDNQFFKICVIGGSQGSASLSRFVPSALIKFNSTIDKEVFVSHQTRTKDIKSIKSYYQTHKISSEVNDYFEDMPIRISKANLIISRSGSSTINEIIYFGKPSILIPYPYDSDNHQHENAKILANLSCADIILDKELSAENLYHLILKTYHNSLDNEYINSKLDKIRVSNPSEKIFNIIKKSL